MKVASDFFEGCGYAVKDVHRTHSYDLWCIKRQTGLRVEVKGSTRSLSQVTLTHNEVRSAQDRGATTALFVVSGIQLAKSRGRWFARGGVATWVADWVPRDKDLKVTEYRYTLPTAMPRAGS